LKSFENGEEFYNWRDSASESELHDLVVEHSGCFSNSVCENEGLLLEDEEIEDLFVCEVAKSRNVGEDTLTYMLNLDSNCDGGRYEQIRWAIIESPKLTMELLNKIDPYGPLMARSITSHPLATSATLHRIFKEFISQDEIDSYLESKQILSDFELRSYKNLIQAKLQL
jgi:hypothetical protein